MTSREFTAETDYARADVFLSEKTGETRSRVKKLADENAVSINGATIKASREVKAGETVKIELPEVKECKARPENIPLDIVYQDNDLAVINKPQGMVVHAGAGQADGTLVNALLASLDHLSGVGGVLRPGIVHRIDKDTSGLLVVAKNDKAHVSLSAQIADKTCSRKYYALLEGCVKAEKGRIATDIGRSPADRLKMAVLPAGRGKNALLVEQTLLLMHQSLFYKQDAAKTRLPITRWRRATAAITRFAGLCCTRGARIRYACMRNIWGIPWLATRYTDIKSRNLL